MTRKIFVNLPVKDLDASKAFFRALGFSCNGQFTDETAACLVISDDIYAMLLTREKFRQFAPQKVCDSRRSNEVLLCLSCERRDEVDELAAKAIAAGGKNVREPMDHGFMYERSIQDLDGHIWEFVWMDPAFVEQNPQAADPAGGE